MNKFLFLLPVFSILTLFGQQEKPRPTLENLKDRHSYVRSSDYDGPNTRKNIYPASMEEETSSSSRQLRQSQGKKSTLHSSPKQIDQKRKLKRGDRSQDRGNGGGNGGTKPKDPEMGKPKPIEFESAEVDPNLRVKPPRISDSFFNSGIWKFLLILIGAALVFFIAYYLIKNYRPRNKKVPVLFSPEELNPVEIPKSELEMRLEDAMRREDYRECVRIYFTFILKELIRLRLIRWKKDYTNRDYLHQVGIQAGGFEESVRIYDLVWYGEYVLALKDYKGLEGTLKSYYEQLTQRHV